MDSSPSAQPCRATSGRGCRGVSPVLQRIPQQSASQPRFAISLSAAGDRPDRLPRRCSRRFRPAVIKSRRGRPCAFVTASPPGVQPAFRAPAQTPAPIVRPPFSARRLHAGRGAFKDVASSVTVFCSVPSQTRPSIVGAGTPMSFHRFERLQSILAAMPTRRIALPQAIAACEDCPARNPPIIDPWLVMAPWKERLQPLHLPARQPEKVAHPHPRPSPELNHPAPAALNKSMGRDPRQPPP